MNKPNLTVLAIDDDIEDLNFLKRSLEVLDRWNVEFLGYSDVEEGLEHLRISPDIDLVFLDYYIGDRIALDILMQLRAEGNRWPVIVLTSDGDERLALRTMRLGAVDYIEKDELSSKILGNSLDFIMLKFAEEQEQQLEGLSLISKKLSKVLKKAARLATSDTTIQKCKSLKMTTKITKVG